MMIKLQYITNFKFKNYLNTEKKYYLFLLITFFILSVIGTINHEMWRDELEAWLIAKDSYSVSNLINNLTYTGHPILWYLCLYYLAKITHNPHIMQYFHVIIITCLIFIFLCYSTFNNLQKTLFCFGCFPLYEYGIISRNYSMGILLLFIFCVLHCRKEQRYWLKAISLSLASLTNIYCLIISFFLASILFFKPLQVAIYNKKKFIYNKELIASLFIYLFGLSTATIQIASARSALSKRAFGTAFQNTLQQNSNHNFISLLKEYFDSSLEFEKVVNGIFRSYIPLPYSLSDSLWGTNFLTDNQHFSTIGSINSAPLMALFLSILLFFVFITIFARQKEVLFMYVGGTATIYIFGFIAKIPELRHNGHLFILLIICYWLFKYNSKHRNINIKQNHGKNKPLNFFSFIKRQQEIALTIILSIQLYAGIKMYTLDLILPFSNIYDVAQFIEKAQLEDSLIVGTSDLKVFPISAWLNKEIYYPEIADFGTFTVWTPQSVSRNSNTTESEIFRQIQKLKKSEHQNLILVTDKQLEFDNLSLNLINSFQKPSLIGETFFVYTVD